MSTACSISNLTQWKSVCLMDSNVSRASNILGIWCCILSGGRCVQRLRDRSYRTPLRRCESQT